MPSAAVAPKPTVLSLAEDLAAGRTTSRALIEAALTRIADTAGEGARTFIKVYSDTARAAADAQDRLRAAGYVASPLAGLPVSIKDLFDVAGERTLAGSKALDDMPPAQFDAPVVARLRAAGAILIGRTNMTEFAFSGVGINPHYGTPGNPHDRSCIPGGSSSGAAVSVADGGAIVAIGTDTGGSVRIPAALCGIVGLKPTQTRISRAGATPLSTTLDSIGPLANSVACCAIADAVMAGEEPVAPLPVRVEGLRLGVPQSFVLDDLAAEVATAFAEACTTLSRAGARIVDLPLTELGEYRAINAQRRLCPDRGLCLASPAARPARRRLRSEGADAYRARWRHDRRRVHRALRRARRSDRQGRGPHRRFRRLADAHRGDHRAADRCLSAGRGLFPPQRADPAQPLGHQFSRSLCDYIADPAAGRGPGRADGGRRAWRGPTPSRHSPRHRVSDGRYGLIALR